MKRNLLGLNFLPGAVNAHTATRRGDIGLPLIPMHLCYCHPRNQSIRLASCKALKDFVIKSIVSMKSNSNSPKVFVKTVTSDCQQK